ncbi:sigma-70 family RNA polymerase sigma factor [Cellulomonas soli]|uniref:sigma-70 family RNA polymerase sigma factor n=1 Tax=Cellulomonas soli TaxID=931535 RepID=UPI003F840786
MDRDAELGPVNEDAELIAATRGGDSGAFGQLYQRHAGAAWVVARQYVDSRADADDVVAEAFTAVYSALVGGSGPDVAFRAYLFTVVRRTAAARRAQGARALPTDDERVLEAAAIPEAAAEEPVLAGLEGSLVAGAYRSLPERWQAVLWYTEVEGLAPAKVAPLLGLTANGVAALAYRAREGLRQAYLQGHLAGATGDGCRDVHGLLGAYVRSGLAARDTRRVEAHLNDCGRCRTLVLELGDVNHGMRGVIAPMVLGVLGLGALAHELPVAGGLAAGAAAMGGAGAASGMAGAGAGAGAAGTGAAGAELAAVGGSAAAGTGAVTATSAGAGAAALVGAGAVTGAAGAAAGAATVGGLAALFSSVPLMAAAAGVVVAGALVVSGVTGVLGGDPVAEGALGVEESAAADGTGAAGASTAPPTSSPTPDVTAGPSAIPDDPLMPTDAATPGDAVAVQDGLTPSSDTGEGTGSGSDADAVNPSGSGGGTGVEPAAPPPPAPPAPAPASVEVALPASADVLEAGAGAQDLAVDVTNSGGTATGALTATVTMPAGLSLDGAQPSASTTVTAGFAPAAVTGWLCVPAADAASASCVLGSLGPRQTARLSLRVSVDEAVEGTDAAVAVVVEGAGVKAQPAPLRMRITPSAARVSAPSTPRSLDLVVGRARELVVPVQNLGGAATTAAAPAVVQLTLPAGVAWEQAPESDGWGCTAQDSATVRCVREVLAGHSASSVRLSLTAGEKAAASSTVLVQLAPSGRGASESRVIALQVSSPPRLALAAPESLLVAPGDGEQPLGVSVSNDGGAVAAPVAVAVVAPSAVRLVATDGDGWTCVADRPGGGRVAESRRAEPGSHAVVCTVGSLAPGEVRELPVSLRVPYGQAGGNLSVLVTAVAPESGSGAVSVISLFQRDLK